VSFLLDPFRPPFMQRALIEALLLALPAGLLGTWIVLRRLAFLTHALGSITFPGLVLGVGLGFSPWLGAIGVAALFIGLQAAGDRRTSLDTGAVTGILLAAGLAAGVVLTSNVFHSAASVDGLLFGSLLGIDEAQIVRTALVVAIVVAFAALGHRGLLTVSFSPAAARSLGYRPGAQDLLLYGVLTLVVVATASTVGGLVVSGLLVVPAATARLLTRTLLATQLVAVAIAAVEGVVGLWVAYRLDVPPGATIAVVAAAVFLLVSLARSLPGRLPAAASTLAPETS
jgi:ABC-type Mn2+/Zn2+ transport system permease subunit